MLCTANYYVFALFLMLFIIFASFAVTVYQNVLSLNDLIFSGWQPVELVHLFRIIPSGTFCDSLRILSHNLT